MKTTESNRMIAEFMGMKSHDQDSSVLLKMTRQGNEVVLLRELQYHTSWSWLMSVVEKLEGIGVNVIIGRMFCDIGYSDPLNKDKNFDVRISSGVKMNAVNGAVIEFIKWYNDAQ
jgi:hypothetical protein